MRKVINRKTYDTNTAKLLGVKYVGEYGEPTGYEEQLFVTKNKDYFIYGYGGLESIYPKPIIKEAAEKEAVLWTRENKK